MDHLTRRQRAATGARRASAWARTSVDSVRERLGLSRRGWLALVVALTTLGVALLVLAGLADAVREGDGLTTDDPRGLAWFVSERSGGLVGAARLLTEIGGVIVLVALAVGAALWFWRRRQPLIVALVPLIALAISGPSVAVGKTFFARSRPDATLRLVTENEPSFPSGHSANSTAVLLAIGLTLAVFVLRRPLARVRGGRSRRRDLDRDRAQPPGAGRALADRRGGRMGARRIDRGPGRGGGRAAGSPGGHGEPPAPAAGRTDGRRRGDPTTPTRLSSPLTLTDQSSAACSSSSSSWSSRLEELLDLGRPGPPLAEHGEADERDADHQQRDAVLRR